MDRTFRTPTDVTTAVVVALSVLLPAPRSAWAHDSATGSLPELPANPALLFYSVDQGQDPSTRDSVFRQVSELTPAMVEAEIERRFNDLRTDVLATQASALQWWMRMMAMVLTVFGIAVPVFGFLGFNRFREIERDTRHSAEVLARAAETTQRQVAEMETVRSSPLGRGGGAESVSLLPGESCSARDPMACLSRGSARADIGQHEEAIRDYDEAIRLSGGIDGVAYHNRGASCLALGRCQEAIADYDAAIRLDSTDAAAFAMRGFAKAEMGMTEEAIVDYTQSIRLQPGDVFPFLNRGRANWETGRHKEAIADFDAAIKLEPDDGGTWLARGIVKREAGMHGDARRDLESALTLAQMAGDAPLVNKVGTLLRNWPT